MKRIKIKQIKIKQLFVGLIVAICFVLPAMTGNMLKAQDSGSGDDLVVEIGDNGSMNWTTKQLRVKGNGFGPSRVKELGRRKILAKRAARIDAYRNMIEVIKGVQVTSGSNVQEMMLESDTISLKAGGMVKGMRVVDVTYSNDGGCEMTMEVNIDQQGQFLLEALNTSVVTGTDNYPKFDWIAMRRNLKNTKARLTHTRSLYAKMQADLRQEGQKLNAANLKLVRLEEQLTATNSSKTQLKDQLAIAQNELTRTKSIVMDLSDKIHNQEVKSAVNETQLRMALQFFQVKEKELDQLSAQLTKYSNAAVFASLDRERLVGYVQRIKEIQGQTNNRIASFAPHHNAARDLSNGSHASNTSNTSHTPNTQYTPHTPNSPTPSIIPNKKEPPQKQSTPQSESSSASPTPAAGTDFTGLLVDARGINLKPVLAPAILNPKKEKMYGIGVIPTEMSSGSTVSYMRGNIDRVKKFKNVGNNPLVVKCIRSVNHSDIMINDADARKVSLIPDLLKEKKVTILF